MEVTPLDLKALDMIAGIKQGLLNKIVNMYLESSVGLVEGIRAAEASGDPVALMKTSHTLKSASANLGATTLAGLCKDLEMTGRANDTEGALSVVEALEAEYARVKVALGRELGRRK